MLMTMSRRTLLASALGLGAISGLPAQDVDTQRERPVFRTSADLVTVDAVVTDGDGRHVTDLTADDFEIEQSGQPQAVRHAAYVPLVSAAADGSTRRRPTEPPGGEPPAGAIPLTEALTARPAPIARTVAIVVDDLGLSFESTAHAREALQRFVDREVQAGDLVAIIRTSGGMGALQQFTTNKRLLHAAIERVRWTVLSRSGIAAFAPAVPSNGMEDDPSDPSRKDVGGRPAGGQTPEAGMAFGEDAEETLRENVLAGGSLGALEFVVRGVQNLPGRKAVIFVSEGFDLFNRKGQAKIYTAFTRLMDRANRAGVVVYTIDGRGLETGRLTAEDHPMPPPLSSGIGGNDGDRVMRELVIGHETRRQTLIRNTEEALHYLAWQTGGFAILNTNDMAGGFRRVLSDLRGYYLLGYDAPPGTPRNWDPGRVTVRVKRAGLAVRARQGFFGPADPNEKPEPLGDALTMAAMSPFGASDIAVRLTSLFGHDSGQGAYVRSLLFIDANGLEFAPAPGERFEASADVLQIAVGENGVLLGEWRRTLTFSLREDQLRDARSRGIVYSTRMTVEKPGGCQVRVAIQDLKSEALGSASQFVEIPRVGTGTLALSGVLVRALRATAGAETPGESSTGTQGHAGAPVTRTTAREVVTDVLGEPAVRIFGPGTNVVYAYEIYDGLPGNDAARLQMSTSLLQGDRVLYESRWTRVNAPPRQGRVRVVPIAGRLSLGHDVPPGAYTLQVTVAADRKRRAAQWVDLEVR